MSLRVSDSSQPSDSSFSGQGDLGIDNHDSDEVGGSGIVAEINITPLTDIFLVLLIIFMVTSSAMNQNAVSIQLPQASQGTSSAVDSKAVVLTLLPDGKLMLNNQSIKAGNWVALETSLKEAFTQTTSRMVVLEGDRKAFLGSAIEVMDRARKVGALQFGIATSEPTQSKKID
jgi:biopolymer transport protein ExbD